MWNFLENIRQKPEHIRKQIGLVLSITLTAIIFFVWLSITLGTPKEIVEDDRSISPFASIKDAISSTTKGIKETVSETGASIFSGVEVYTQ